MPKLKPPPLNFFLNEPIYLAGYTQGREVSGVFIKTPDTYSDVVLDISTRVAKRFDIKTLSNNPLLHRRLALVQQVLNNTKVVNLRGTDRFIKHEVFKALLQNNKVLKYALKHGSIIDYKTECSFKITPHDLTHTVCRRCQVKDCNFYLYFNSIYNWS